MVISLEPCAIAMMLIRSLEMAVKILPARPGIPRIPSPTTADGEIGAKRLQCAIEIMFADEEAEALPVAGTAKDQDFHVGQSQCVQRARHHAGTA